jgi:IS4 transposase
MMSYTFTYKGKNYGVEVREEPTVERLELLFKNALETLQALEEGKI